MRLLRASDRSVLVVFENTISAAAHARVVRLTNAIRAPGIVNLHPAYASVLISFDPRRLTHEAVEQIATAADQADVSLPERRLVDVPVRYGNEFGPDLGDVASHSGLPADRVIDLHSSVEYIVYFLGFSPGFPYLGGMPDQLATPRLDSPRKRVPAGSVGIAGTQTGIYPLASPGGWRIIGRTPLRLFSADAEPPAMLRMGDRLRFVPITDHEFDRYSRG